MVLPRRIRAQQAARCARCRLGFAAIPVLGLLVGLWLAPLAANEDLFYSRAQADADYAAARHEAALIGYEQWVKQQPRDAEAWFRLGNLYTQQLRPMDALTAYRKAQLLKPEDGRAWHNMGMLYLRLAVESYDNLRREVPANDPLVPYAERVLSGILDLIALRLQDAPPPALKPLAPAKP
jgi:cytochrome c-type biogenesis protein CcmH/NrfG